MIKKHTKEELEQLRILQEKKNKDFIKDFIHRQTESQVVDKFSDQNLDKEIEKKKILETISDFWKIKNIRSNVRKTPLAYQAIFHQEFYKEIYRLNNWSVPETITNKPWIISKFTNEIIYYRFSQEVLPFLRIINPYIILGKRSFKHHQYLTEGARVKLSQFIDQATQEMKKYDTWNNFRIGYCEKFNVPYQLKFMFPK